MTKVMIIDGGARGHTLAKAHMFSNGVKEVMVAPGNDGMKGDFIASFGESHFHKILTDSSVSLKDPESIRKAALAYKPDLIEVAQDDAISLGTVDLLEKEGFSVFGPSRLASQIEWDKAWARDFMGRHEVPHPEYKEFKLGEKPAINYANEMVRKHGSVYFKASGLAGGKGAIHATNDESVILAFKSMKRIDEGTKGAAQIFLVEEGLVGEEFSYYAIVDGENYKCFISSQDNKTIWNNDKGPNTGGMGCNAPALVTEGLEKRIEKEIIEPTIRGLASEGRPYKGILYLGGMYDKENDTLKVVEFNSRWGDPECHCILPGLGIRGDMTAGWQGGTDYFDLVNYAVKGKLKVQYDHIIPLPT